MPDLVAHRRTAPDRIDGDVTKAPWDSVDWSPRFVDMVSGAPGLYDTRCAMAWDDTHLFVAFTAEEPVVTAHLTERNAIVFTENDLELFVDGGDCYYELEVNAANTVYEVLFVWRDAYVPDGRFAAAGLDVHDPQTFTFAGDDDRSGPTFWRGSHPRGARWAFTGFDLPGLQTAVIVDGTMNDDRDVDRGWSLEIALPWASLGLLADGRSIPPTPGDEWRMFLGRFQQLELVGHVVRPTPAMVLTPHGVYDTHRPDRWSVVRFDE